MFVKYSPSCKAKLLGQGHDVKKGERSGYNPISIHLKLFNLRVFADIQIDQVLLVYTFESLILGHKNQALLVKKKNTCQNMKKGYSKSRKSVIIGNIMSQGKSLSGKGF